MTGRSLAAILSAIEMIRGLRNLPVEAIFWSAALVLLAVLPPTVMPQLCLSSLLGLGPCPGCGLGRSVHALLHGNWHASWSAHPLGGVVLLGLALRIRGLLLRTREEREVAA